MVAQKIRTNVYLDSDMKEQAKNIFKKYGVSLSDAINMFLTQSVMERGLPFEMKIPNDETIQAIEDARNGINSDTITLEELEKESKQYTMEQIGNN
jgi:DNA-damage-inducible protein J